MRPERLTFALEQIRPNQWARFEEFASSFLSVEYPGLRTVAGSGDRGRDAEIVQAPDQPDVLIQYSVAEDWDSKLRGTARQVAREFLDASVLIYVTNQKIGPLADDVKATIRREQNLFVDVRDRSWFVERYSLDAPRGAAAESLVEDIAMPILADRGLVEHKAPALSSGEARAACVYLSLQWNDDTREKGLTKLCFEALVRCVLRDTDPRNRLSRDEIRSRVADLLNVTDRDRSDLLTDGALIRLERGAVRRWTKDDQFCLTHDEKSRLQAELENVELEERELIEAIAWETARTYEAFDRKPPQNIRDLADCVRAAVESVLLKQGETFAAAVTTGRRLVATGPDLESAITSAMGAADLEPKHGNGSTAQILEATARVVLTEPAEPVQDFFRKFADAYTLFAFLKETPDVQTAVVKMFSVGEIWLDTTVLLPLLAETLVEERGRRRFTNTLRAARDCGLKLRMTEGVLEEVEAHTWNCIQFARQQEEWRSRVPFLISTFMLTGQPARAFPGWVERFRGAARPKDDLAEYFAEEHGVEMSSLVVEADRAPTELRGRVQEIWATAHETRRGGQLDPDTQARLVAHDVENYLGVVQRRDKEEASGFGYRTWWLTLDRTAYEVPAELSKEFGSEAPASPVLSPDFMVSYLAVGPLRAQLDRTTEAKLPLSVADLGAAEAMPRELIAKADAVRERLAGKDDRIVRREVRDQLDKSRRRVGPQARGGMGLVREELVAELSSGASC